jgi:peptidoglycan/LPS O-acetylase OafA/YrhL
MLPVGGRRAANARHRSGISLNQFAIMTVSRQAAPVAAKKLGHQRLEFLDQLRAIAITTVMIDHYRVAWLPGGGIGVGIFFALSGFLIATILLDEEKMTFKVAAAFLVRRFLRIYPAYLVAVLLYLGLCFLLRPAEVKTVAADMPGLLTFLSLPSSWVGYGIDVLWTLQVEMAFYCVVPLFMLLLGRTAGLIALSVGLLACFFAIYPVLSPLAHNPLLCWGGALALGSLLSVAWKAGLLDLLDAGGARLLAILGILGISGLVFIPPLHPWLWHWEVFGGSLCGCLMIAAFLAHAEMPVVPGAAFLGRISYSLYLLHGTIIDFELYPFWIGWLFLHFKVTIPWAPFGTFVLVAVAAATVSYYLIERPGIWVAKRLSRSLKAGSYRISALSAPGASI